MQITPSQMQKILTSPCSFSQLGFSMMITRMTERYSKDSNPKTLQQCTDEANRFLEKYRAIMQKDYEKILNL